MRGKDLWEGRRQRLKGHVVVLQHLHTTGNEGASGSKVHSVGTVAVPIPRIGHSRQHGVLGLAHTHVGQPFSPVARGQSERLEGRQRVLQAVSNSDSLLVARGGDAADLLEAWQRKPSVRGGRI